MAPPVPAHQKRFTANPTRPARYRPGKAVPEETSSDEEDDEEEEVSQPKPQLQKPQARKPAKPQAQSEDDEDSDDQGFVTDEEEDGSILPTAKATTQGQTKKISPQDRIIPTHTPSAQSIIAQEEAESDPEHPSGSEASSGSEEESEDDSDSSSDSEPEQRKFQRPTFISKTARKQSSSAATPAVPAPSNQSPSPSIPTSAQDEATAARRLAEAETLIKQTIERDTQARLSGKKSWDDDDELPPEALVDDTDGLDPEAEHLAWRLRELTRLKRDREAMIAREKELEEIERRRNLTKEERDREDREFLESQREEKESSRGEMKLLGRYHHKGAFFMDDENSTRLAKRDLVGAKFADEVSDKSVLPEYMRIRDMTKLGKKGRTRYTDLKGQDTGRFGDEVKRWRGSGFGNDRDGAGRDDYRGLDERFRPDDDSGRRHGGPRETGANGIPVGERRVRRRSASPDDREASGRRDDTYRPQRRSRSRSNDRQRRRKEYSRSKSRSRSPPRRRRRSYSRSPSRSRSPPPKSTRRRSPSPYLERDKRRRIEA